MLRSRTDSESWPLGERYSRQPTARALLVRRLELERDPQLGPVRLDLRLADLQVLFDHLRTPKLAQGFGCALDRRFGRLLPGLGARSDKFNDLVDALRH